MVVDVIGEKMFVSAHWVGTFFYDTVSRETYLSVIMEQSRIPLADAILIFVTLHLVFQSLV